MAPSSRVIILLTLSSLALATSLPATAQAPKPGPPAEKVYVYAEQMPVYQNGQGNKLLARDLLREFRTISATSGCIVPDFPIYVSLTVGAGGGIYAVRSINNQPLPPLSKDPGAPDGRGQRSAKRRLQQLPAACEQALVEAAKRLPRLQPGTQNGRRVAVGLAFRLI
jgi:hypothetical protein